MELHRIEEEDLYLKTLKHVSDAGHNRQTKSILLQLIPLLLYIRVDMQFHSFHLKYFFFIFSKKKVRKKTLLLQIPCRKKLSKRTRMCVQSI